MSSILEMDEAPVGTIVRFSKFNNKRGPVWGIAVSHRGDYTRYTLFAGKHEDGRKFEEWPVCESDDEGEIVPEDEVPDEIWAKLAAWRLVQ